MHHDVFSRGLATLELAVSVGRSVDWSVRKTLAAPCLNGLKQKSEIEEAGRRESDDETMMMRILIEMILIEMMTGLT